MIRFAPSGKPADSLTARLFDVVASCFALAQSAQDVAAAVGAIFTATPIGTTTLTLGTTAPDAVFATTPTHWPTFTLPDGTVVIVAAWRVR